MKLIKRLFVVCLFTAAMGKTALAQTPVPLTTQPTTNSSNFSLYSLNGGTNVAAGGTLLVQSQPFYIYRGRGFSFTEGILPASSTTEGVTNVFQLGTEVSTPNGLVTNWLNSFLIANFPCAGASKVFDFTNFTASQVDNANLARLYAITNLGSVVVNIDPTNSYTQISP